MAKVKAKGPPKPQPGPAAAERVTVINLKGSQDLRDWLNGLSDRTMIPAAAITRAAWALWAKQNGHPAPPTS
jgi:hypothetical protein